MATRIQERVKEMYEAHPFPRLADPMDPEWIERTDRYFRYLGMPPDLFKGAFILDAGCGTGEKSLHMAKLGARRVLGIDLSTASVRHGQGNAARYGADNLTFQNGSVLELPFANDSFDIVHSEGVLHHTTDPYGGFRELVRVLKPGGMLMVQLYNRYADWLYHLERALVASLAGDDIDRRVQVSKRLFAFKERGPAARDNMDLETRLYDKFAHPRASAHGIGEVLGWFRKQSVEFRGIYPPLNLKDMLRIVARKNKGHYQVPWVLKPAALVSDAIVRFLPADGVQGSYPYPSRIMQFLVQSGLFVAGIQDYSFGVCFSGVKTVA